VRIAVLSGGVGGARFLHGLTAVIPPGDVTAIVNVGDDFEPFGLPVSPDLDTVVYTLAGLVDEERGWGVAGDGDRALRRAARLGTDTWFWLGDEDLGLHLARAELLRRGLPLSAATARLTRELGLATTILPVTDDRLRTMVRTDAGELDFQTWYVRRRHADAVRGLRFDGAAAARPAPGVVEALEAADAVIVAPSNPLISIDPILVVPGVREAVAARRERVVAVSPIVAGEALRGPAAAMLRSLGHEAGPPAVAAHYAGLVGTLVLDRRDAGHEAAVAASGLAAVVADTIMDGPDGRRRLARAALDALSTGSAR
jgi:LPPG:FO 2-phospho-L-lactate transferase